MTPVQRTCGGKRVAVAGSYPHVLESPNATMTAMKAPSCAVSRGGRRDGQCGEVAPPRQSIDKYYRMTKVKPWLAAVGASVGDTPCPKRPSSLKRSPSMRAGAQIRRPG